MLGGAIYPIPALVRAGAHRAGCKERQYPGSSTSCHRPNSPIATPGQVLRIPRLFTNSRTTFSPHSWDILESGLEHISAHLTSLKRADCSCSAFTAQGSLLLLQWEGKEGQRAEVLMVVSSEKMPGTGARATRFSEEASCSPSGSSKPRSQTWTIPSSCSS